MAARPGPVRDPAPGRGRDRVPLCPTVHALWKRTEGIWSLLKRALVNFAAADLATLIRIVKRKLKKIQYRPT